MSNAYGAGIEFTIQVSDSVITGLNADFLIATTTGTNGSAEPFDYSDLGVMSQIFVRLYFLEDSSFATYIQAGTGAAFSSGTIKEQSNEVKYSGHDNMFSFAFGFDIYASSKWSINLEAGYRMAKIDRLTVSEITGSFSSLTQTGKGQELEVANRDFNTDYSGLVISLGFRLQIF
jgi:hypothetical protein